MNESNEDNNAILIAFYLKLIIYNRYRLLMLFLVGCVLGAFVLLFAPRYYSYTASLQIPRLNDNYVAAADASTLRRNTSDKMDNDLLAQVSDYITFRYIQGDPELSVDKTSLNEKNSEKASNWQSRIANNTVLRNLLNSPFVQFIKRTLYGKETTSVNKEREGLLQKAFFFNIEKAIENDGTKISKLDVSNYKQYLIVSFKSLRRDRAESFLNETLLPDIKLVFQPRLGLIISRIEERDKIIEKSIGEVNKDLAELAKLKYEVGAHAVVQGERVEALKRLSDLGQQKVEVDALLANRQMWQIRLMDARPDSTQPGGVSYTVAAIIGGLLLCIAWMLGTTLKSYITTILRDESEIESGETNDNVMSIEEKIKKII